ncbi:MAG: substrate-binding domain-containing protein [Clostridiales bacterium]|nr:substrate-binding domain-containing protein [Clostridiales bacterium]
MKMKKVLAAMLGAVMVAGCLTGCGGSSTGSSTSPESSAESEGAFDSEKAITVVSREDGSGTRGAFIELFGIEEKDADGNKIDNTTEDASVTNNTSVMMSTVAGNEYAIGYISLGSLNDSVKAVKIDGAEATVDNIKSGAYKVSRPFNIVTKDKVNEVAQDFIDYIMSADGQAVIEENGYIKNSENGAFTSKKPKGKVVVAGSSSVSPVMEKLKEAYSAINPDADIEIQTSDSTTGVESAISGICDIGMASRELKDTETSEGVKATAIALDGIAVVVNKANSIEDLSSEAVKGIYTGEIESWADVQ